MFEFQKLCRSVEELEPAQRAAILAQKSVEVADKLKSLDLPGVDPIDALAAFAIGSVVADGEISEKDYLYIYPSLVKAFGEACDLAGIKHRFKVSSDARREIKFYTEQLLSVLSAVDDELGSDIVLLCLLVTSADGKVSPRERNYIKQLCKA